MRAGLRVPLKIRLVKRRPQHCTPSSGAKPRHLPASPPPVRDGTGGARPGSGAGPGNGAEHGAPGRAAGGGPGPAPLARAQAPPWARGGGSSPRHGGSMRCQVSVLYFARSAELAGLRCETLSVPQEITSLQLWEEIVKVHPRLALIRDQVVFAVRQEYVLLGDQLLVLQPGDEVAIIPPISGG
ncbi:molybdopterin synthase catalytic subunit isoform X1 [Taeniopygia guttata]|uniref:molybdopterin synthase catalytic subunit isoform X1 n=1 Tax=Taeniopygia guttata TaxID=59729 RepID=UPI0013F1F101